MRRPRTATIDAAWFDTGAIGRQTASLDNYFQTGTVDPTLRIVIDAFVTQLGQPQRTAVEMCLMQGLSYAEAARTISIERGKRTDPKTVWRWARQGADAMRRMLTSAAWTSEMSKVPR